MRQQVSVSQTRGIPPESSLYPTRQRGNNERLLPRLAPYVRPHPVLVSTLSSTSNPSVTRRSSDRFRGVGCRPLRDHRRAPAGTPPPTSARARPGSRPRSPRASLSPQPYIPATLLLRTIRSLRYLSALKGSVSPIVAQLPWQVSGLPLLGGEAADRYPATADLLLRRDSELVGPVVSGLVRACGL
jgi:hypothetical protein